MPDCSILASFIFLAVGVAVYGVGYLFYKAVVAMKKRFTKK